MAGKDLSYYRSQEYTVQLELDREDGSYFARVKELSGCMTCGSTLSEAVRNIEEAKEAWLETALSLGIPIPEPVRPVKTFADSIFKTAMAAFERALAGTEQESDCGSTDDCLPELPESDYSLAA